MAIPTLVATVSGPTSNSYIDADEAWDLIDLLPTKGSWPTKVAATAQIGAGANGVVTITVVEAGADGNDYGVRVVAGVGNNVALTVALVGDLLTVTLGTDGFGVLDPAKNTALLVSAAVHALTEFSAVASGTGATIVPVTSEVGFAGGDDRDDLTIPALISATRLLDATLCYGGTIATETQALALPRIGMTDRHGRALASDAIPTEAKWAEVELARLLLAKELWKENVAAVAGLKRVKAGPVELEFRDVIATRGLPPSVSVLIPSSWLCVETTEADALIFDVLRY